MTLIWGIGEKDLRIVFYSVGRVGGMSESTAKITELFPNMDRITF